MFQVIHFHVEIAQQFSRLLSENDSFPNRLSDRLFFRIEPQSSAHIFITNRTSMALCNRRSTLYRLHHLERLGELDCESTEGVTPAKTLSSKPSSTSFNDQSM
ncbi:hypothetical protein AHF37_02843 [Paragonimus kellicotti]|nr:hypothetical protein AHF37_02843 [Paragonimus kellicotti]